MSQSSSSMTGRIALVTGSAQGLGFDIARRLGQDGFEVVICDLVQADCDRAAAQLAKDGVTAHGFAADVSDESAVTALMSWIDGRWGRLDAVVNNAGILGLIEGRKPGIDELSLALWTQTLSVNLTGPFLVVRAAVPLMRRNSWGRIINISSRAARMRTGIGNANYAASKAGLIGFSRVIAGELGPDGITVNCIAPSRIETSMTQAFAESPQLLEQIVRDAPVGRIGTPQDIAAAASYLCSDGASFVTGVVLDVNGGSYMA